MPSSNGRPGQAVEGLWSLARQSVGPHSGTLRTAGATGPTEAAEIEAMFAAVETDGPSLALRLSHKLHPLVQRGVPPRAIETAPVPRAARLRFADGTTVVVKGTAAGDLAVLAMAMQHGSVRPAACRTGVQGETLLQLTWTHGRRRLSLRVVGLDQPD